eukprot:900564-Pleurochrysis_carterae.AAC.1
MLLCSIAFVRPSQRMNRNLIIELVIMPKCHGASRLQHLWNFDFKCLTKMRFCATRKSRGGGRLSGQWSVDSADQNKSYKN